MRILFINYEYPPLGGGGGIVNEWLAEELAKSHDVTVLTSQAFDLDREEDRNGVRILRAPAYLRKRKSSANMPSMASFVATGIAAGRKLLKEQSFDVMNTHFAIPSGPVGNHLSKAFDVPNVLSVHGGDLFDPSKWMSPHRHAILRMVVRHICRSADQVVGQSSNTIENLHRYYDKTIDASLVPLGIPEPERPPARRADLGLSEEEFVMCSIGRLVKRKQNDQLIRLVSELGNENVRLVLVGSGPAEGELKALASDLGVTQQVMFAGFVPNARKLELLAASDIFASASEHEGFGLVFLEAMAQGLPVVCYDFGGQTDFIRNDVNGYAVPLNDLEALVSAVRDLMSDKAKRLTMSNTNLREVRSLFIDSCARRYEAIFREVAR